MHEIIFEADTFWGKTFDIVLLWAIVLSVLTVMLESVEGLEKIYGDIFKMVEWSFTILFSIEYMARIYCVKRPLKYIFSFLGLIDLLSTLPTYLSLFAISAQYLLVVRSVRLLRVFRILKLSRYLGEAEILWIALKRSRYKITVFLGAVLSVVLIMGTFMYLIEGPENGFTNIPKSIYWAIVTLTTVGYGDIAPKTTLGQFIASAVMILGYAILAVPTGIVSVELANAQKQVNTVACMQCSLEGHDDDAKYCKHCGAKL
ncbi:MAG: ion transporter [Leptospiraceae bacterium]|nr:ion transporter [Leptospiraceae bacterium]